MCSDDDAVLVQAELLVPVKCFGGCAKLRARELHNVVRRYARAVRTAVVRLGDECVRLSFERRGAICALIHQHWWTHPLPMVVTYALVVAVPGARNGAGRLARCHSFESQTVWSVCSAVSTGRRMDARQMHAAVDSGCDENVHQMCEFLNRGRVLVATKVMALRRRPGDGRALRTHALLVMERRTTHSGLSVGREKSS